MSRSVAPDVMLQLMSLIFATQLTALATTGLAVFAVVTAVLALLAWRKQSTEVAIAQAELTEQRKVSELQVQELTDSLTERHEAVARRQWASTVVAWRTISGGGTVHNTGTRPVRDLTVR